MGDSAGTGCAIVLGVLLALPFRNAACPILAGIAVGLFFSFVIVPIVAWLIAQDSWVEVRATVTAHPSQAQRGTCPCTPVGTNVNCGLALVPPV